MVFVIFGGFLVFFFIPVLVAPVLLGLLVKSLSKSPYSWKRFLTIDIIVISFLTELFLLVTYANEELLKMAHLDHIVELRFHPVVEYSVMGLLIAAIFGFIRLNQWFFQSKFNHE